MTTATARGFEGDDASNRVQQGIDMAGAYAHEHSSLEPDRGEAVGGYEFVPYEVGRRVTGAAFGGLRLAHMRFPAGYLLLKPDFMVHTVEMPAGANPNHTAN